MLRDPEDNERQVIRDLLGPSAGNVLEVGCGDGRLTGELMGVADRILGLDPDPSSIDQARSLLGNAAGWILGSGESLPFADHSVDTVVFSLSLHHHDPGRALAEARRVLRGSGRILVLEPSAESPINRLFRLLHDEDEAYDRAAAAVDACGLEVVGLGTFASVWRFDDFGEMVGYLHAYFDLEPEHLKVEAMEEMLGNQRRDRPLEAEDATRWWLLAATRTG